MAGLHRTIGSLSRYRKAWESLQGEHVPQGIPGGDAPLTEVREFGPNPGRLRMLTYVPPRTEPGPALVVVLHGCKQDAAGYDRGSGWSHLADQHGFLLLYPEQQPQNNPSTCFTWFEPGAWQRGSSEAASIRRMIEHMIKDHGVDRARIFVTGLSAGGAMANLLLATCPEVFAAGAIIAGLPYGAATDVPSAFETMFKGQTRSAKEWGDLVRGASAHEGPWPRVSVWHGSADRTVVPGNGQEIVKQWIDVHDVPLSRRVEPGVGFSREVWHDPQGRAAVEQVIVPGMAHGTPLSPGEGDDLCGEAGAFMLDVGVSSTHHIARFFGLDGGTSASPQVQVDGKPLRTDIRLEPDAAPRKPEPAIEAKRLPGDVGETIRRALRAAGLLRTP